MFDEPEINPLDDTHPTGTYPQVNLQGEDDTSVRISQSTRHPSSGQRFLGLLLLLGAFALTIGAVVLISSPTETRVITVTNTPTVPAVVMTTQEASQAAQIIGEGEFIDTDLLTAAATIDATPVDQGPIDLNALPTLSVDTAAQLLQTPISPILIDNPQRVVRAQVNPFTLIPDRPRNTVIQYTIQQGDTIYDIAQRFGLTQESIAWSNDRSQIWTLIPGDTLNIPPIDGVYVQMVGGISIRQIAEQYDVTDVDTVMTSEANPQLRSLSPDTIPPSGTWIFIPGGVAEEVNWAPQIETSSGGSGTSGGQSGNLVGFQTTDPGSCGMLPPGAGTGWGYPLSGYTVTRGFSPWHPGIDLSAATGTPVYAANGGTIIFSGRNNWGYGIAVVISSGPFTTLYGHLSATAIGCGETVGTGQIIGYVGSTGNSSGPHLHFEIMYNGVRGDPAATMPF
jgi:murein DD-endopeptidase MepM/ murein hydrolase activator NlpD